jgi:hypothetical protein
MDTAMQTAPKRTPRVGRTPVTVELHKSVVGQLEEFADTRGLPKWFAVEQILRDGLQRYAGLSENG